MLKKLLSWRPLILIALIFMLIGCAAKLAPNYDRALVEGLTTSNIAVMEFLAFVAGGTQKDTFDQRKYKYANLIGRFDALAIQAKARPVPKHTITDKGILNGGITDETKDSFLDSLEDMALNFVKTLRGLLMVTIEKVWNAIVGVIWKAIETAAGIALPTPDIN